jgi:hypothetical protein
MRHHNAADAAARNRAILAKVDPCELARLDAAFEAFMARNPDAQAWYDANVMAAPMNIPVETRSAGDEQAWPVGASVTADRAKPRAPVAKPKEVEPQAKSRDCRLVISKKPGTLTEIVPASRWRTVPRS